MKLADVEIGGRYRAKVSGQMVTVRVTDIRETTAFGNVRSKTVIEAVNERTGRQIAIRSARRLRSRVGGHRHIGDLNRVDQLAEGERVRPEPGTRYDLRLVNGKPLGKRVEFVFRRESELLATTDTGETYPVSGDDAYILCPSRKT